MEASVGELSRLLTGTAADEPSEYGPPEGPSVSASISNVAARLFWLKHFGKHSASVPWEQFKCAFETEYGDQVRACVSDHS